MKNQIEILQHALGVGEYADKPSTRNHFVTGEGDRDFQDCQALVKQGFMAVRSMAKELTGGGTCFVVTEEGRSHMLANRKTRPAAPKLTRSQERYARFLEYGDVFDSFLSYCRWDAQPERSWNQDKVFRQRATRAASTPKSPELAF